MSNTFNPTGDSTGPIPAPVPAPAVDAFPARAIPVQGALFEYHDDGTITSLVPTARPGQRSNQPKPAVELTPAALVYHSAEAGVWLYQANCLEFLDVLYQKYGDDGRFDVIFADPPYFLSNGGITCHGGKMVKVDKGDWDKSKGADLNHEFNLEWLRRCQRVLKPNGSIWVTGTQHVIFSVGFAMQQLGFKILNTISWEKPNPPPNLSCRFFTHSTESLIWAARNTKSRHVFNYRQMREMNGGKQMKTVWKIGPPMTAEKACGKHPTQKPLALVERCLLASSKPGDLVLDPFLGAGTTAVAAARLGRKCVGVDLDLVWVNVSAERVQQALESKSKGDSEQKEKAIT